MLTVVHVRAIHVKQAQTSSYRHVHVHVLVQVNRGQRLDYFLTSAGLAAAYTLKWGQAAAQRYAGAFRGRRVLVAAL